MTLVFKLAESDLAAYVDRLPVNSVWSQLGLMGTKVDEKAIAWIMLQLVLVRKLFLLSAK